MNNELLRNNYLVVPNFISPEHAKKLEKEFHADSKKLNFEGDQQVPNCLSKYDYIPALEVLANKTPFVGEIIGETVLPTYVYSRIYHNGAVLTKHCDRLSCEISVTLHLGGDKPWPIHIETPEGDERCITLNPGDGMLYLGCIAPHWRNKFEGTEYAQFFLHYVRSRGYCAPNYFDKEPMNNKNLDILIEEYEDMQDQSNKSRKNLILPRNRRESECDNDNTFFNAIKKQRNDVLNRQSDIEIEEIQDEEEFVDFDEVVICNKKYEEFLIKKDSPNLINKPKPKEESNEKSSNEKSSSQLKDFIWYGKEVIDPDFCDDILNEYVESDLWEPTIVGSGYDPSARRCSQISTSEKDIIEQNPEIRQSIDDKLFEIVKDLVEEYRNNNPGSPKELEIQEDSGYELLKYEVGDFYIQHTDSFKLEPRTLTIIMSMNNGYEGGEVALFDRELVYKLDVGDVLIFPSNFMYPHEILPVTSGTRYSMITWVV